MLSLLFSAVLITASACPVSAGDDIPMDDVYMEEGDEWFGDAPDEDIYFQEDIFEMEPSAGDEEDFVTDPDDVPFFTQEDTEEFEEPVSAGEGDYLFIDEEDGETFVTGEEHPDLSRTGYEEFLEPPADGSEMSGDEAFAAFLEESVTGEMVGVSSGKKRGSLLSGQNRAAYDILSGEIAKIASGNRASTEFVFSVYDLGFETERFTSADLNVGSVPEGDEIPDEVYEAFHEKIDIDFERVLSALMADYPYEMYWFDKTSYETKYTGFTITARYDTEKNEYVYCILFDSTLSLAVAADFADGLYSVDTSVGQSVLRTAEEVDSIVASYAGKTDMEKLYGYLNTICDLVSYDYAAADDANNTPYGNPWQIISVFDGDPSTNVVCEGYAKAFQYLCDRSDFSNPELGCISVTGYMGTCDYEAHMWNIVSLGEGKNYLADIANCDDKMAGRGDGLFLVPHSTYSNISDGYAFEVFGQEIYYIYDERAKQLYTAGELEITEEPLEKPETSEYVENSYRYLLSVVGAEIIEYTGSDSRIEIPSHVNGVAVRSIAQNAFRGNTKIESVTVPGTVRTLGEGCFYGCTSLRELILSEGVTGIGWQALTETAIRELKLPSTLRRFHESCMYELEAFAVAEGNPAFRAHEGALYAYNDRHEGWYLAEYPAAKTEEYYAVPDYASYVCGTAVTMPDNSENPTNNPYLKRLNIGNCELVDDYSYLNCIVEPAPTSSLYAISDDILYSADFETLVYVPDIFDEVVVKAGTKTIGESAFAHNSLTGVSLPEGLVTIGEDAFNECEALKAIDIPAGVQTIGASAFQNCGNLSDVRLKEGLLTIGFKAFYDCTELKEIELPETLTQLDESFGETSLKSLRIPASVTKIGDGAFSGCWDLKWVQILNPGCEIDTDECTFTGYTTIYGHPGSTAQSYAEMNGRNFFSLEEYPEPPVFTFVEGYEEGCETDGLREHYEDQFGRIYLNPEPGCSVPSEEIRIPACGHMWDTDYSVIEFPSGDRPGVKAVICGRCGAVNESATRLFYNAKLQFKSSSVKKTYGSGVTFTNPLITAETDGAITYYTSNKNVAEVDPVSGKVTVHNSGSCVITAASEETEKYLSGQASYNLTVEKAANKITVSSRTITAAGKAQVVALDAKCLGNAILSYKSNKSAVKVTTKGKVTIPKNFAGKVTITITACERKNYKAATVKRTITVKPYATAVSSLTNLTGRKMKITWKKNLSATGYQIWYSTDRTFKKGVKKSTVTKASVVTKTIGGLTKGKTWYVKIRAYKAEGTAKYYSAWSAVKGVRIAK